MRATEKVLLVAFGFGVLIVFAMISAKRRTPYVLPSGQTVTCSSIAIDHSVAILSDCEDGKKYLVTSRKESEHE